MEIPDTNQRRNEAQEFGMTGPEYDRRWQCVRAWHRESERIRNLVRGTIAKGESQRAIGRATAIPHTTLQRFVDGQPGLKGNELLKLAAYHGTTLDFSDIGEFVQ